MLINSLYAYVAKRLLETMLSVKVMFLLNQRLALPQTVRNNYVLCNLEYCTNISLLVNSNMPHEKLTISINAMNYALIN